MNNCLRVRMIGIITFVIALSMAMLPVLFGQSVSADDGKVKLVGYSKEEWDNNGWPEWPYPVGMTYIEAKEDNSDNYHIARLFDYREYNGEPYEIPIKVYTVASYAPVELTEGQDYTLRYEDNINAGIAKIIINGIGKYEGTVQETFEISPKDVDESSVRISKKALTNSKGKVLCPSIKIVSEGNLLKKGVDYTVTLNNDLSDHYGKATIRCKGNYENYIPINKYYAIQPDKPKIKLKIKKVMGTYTGFIIKVRSHAKTQKLRVQVYKDKKCKKRVKTNGIEGSQKYKGQKTKQTYKLRTKLKKGKIYYIRFSTGASVDPNAETHGEIDYGSVIGTNTIWSPWSRPFKFRAK